MDKEKVKKNLYVHSEIINGVFRAPFAFLFGGLNGLILNALFTGCIVHSEKKEEHNRQQKRSELLSSKTAKYIPDKYEMNMMFKSYTEEFKHMNITFLDNYGIKSNRCWMSKSNNIIYECSLCFKDGEEKRGIKLCCYDFWCEFFKRRNNVDIKKYRFRFGKEMIGFYVKSEDMYYLGDIM